MSDYGTSTFDLHVVTLNRVTIQESIQALRVF